MDELSNLKKENRKLEGKLRSCDERIETLVINNADLTDKVANFEVRALAA